MIELSQIAFHFFILSIFFIFPVTPYLNQRYLRKYNFDVYNIFCLNIVLNLNIYLIISIFIRNLELLFTINLILAFLFILTTFKKNIKIIKTYDWRLFLIFFLVNISIFTSIAEDPKLNWDGIYQWLPKASTYFHNLGFTIAGAPSYPHLGGFLWGYFWKNSFLEQEYVGRFFYAFFYVITIFSLLKYLKFNKKFKFPIICIFLTLIFSLTFDRFLFGGYQDVLLFSLILISSNFLYLIIAKRQNDFFILVIFFLSAFICCWIKQEGFIYFLILITIVVFSEKNKIKKIYSLISSLILIIIYFLIKNYLIGDLQFDQKININIFNFHNFYFLIDIFHTLLINFVTAIIKYPLWLFILFFILASIPEYKKIKNLRLIYSFLILNFLFIFLVIFYSCLNLGLESCNLIMKVSMDRIMYQSSGFYLIWIIYLFYNLKIFNKIRSNLK